MHLHKCDHVFFTWGLGGVGGRAINRQTAIFVAASPQLKKIQYRDSSTAKCINVNVTEQNDRAERHKAH